ncbi:MAG TPA: ATP-binding protein [Terriglobales bacterium]|jgi:two-component system, NtrC family, nitrogen regulation sensor histidine kinase NtrY|nr:ATP-binding protein [Terriglobales bacterium]
MASRSPLGPKDRKRLIIFLAAGSFVLFAILLSESSFDLPFINPSTTQQTVFLAALSALVFLLFVTLTFVLARNLIKLFAERRMGVLGSKFRTRLVVGSLLLSFLPVIVMFWFAYGLMNRSIERWFSTPVEEVRQDTALMAQMLAKYVAANAHAEAVSIASAPETQHAFDGHSFSGVLNQFRMRGPTLQGGFAIAILSGDAEASFGSPAEWPLLKPKIPRPSSSEPQHISWNGIEYVLGTAPVGDSGEILVAMPLPANFTEARKQLELSQQRYLELAKARRTVRRTYMVLLWWITGMVLFASMWLALYLSRLVTRPVVALAEATQEISRGNLDYRVEVPAADELGDLVRSFNQMAGELSSNRRKLETASHELSDANSELERRRQHIETILESIPTGVLSLDAELRVRHVNQALLRMLRPSEKPQMASTLIGAALRDLFASEVLEDLEHLLRRADRMGTTTTQMEFAIQRSQLNVAVTVATLEHHHERIGYVLVFEDLSDLLRAQKQAAWREVARRVAHEIKNPLTPIALSADRILRHLDRSILPDATSVDIVRGCAEAICGAVETVRNLVNEFATLARFPSSQPQPANINGIVESALSMFNGRVDEIHMRTLFSTDLPQVMADSDAMKRAIANLVDNAAEAVQASAVKEIEISTSLVPDHDLVEICVSDSGPGVTQDLKERLFLPYFSTKKRGTGLGLAIVSRIIEDHHGSIRVEENKPAGARFIIELPIAAHIAGAVHATQNA